MDSTKFAAMLLIIGGLLALAYGGFSYTKATHRADVGPLHLEVAEKEHVNIPLWAGVGAVLVGGVLLMARRKR